MGNGYMAQCRRMRVKPDGLAVAGRILGIISTILFILIVLFYVAFFALFLTFAPREVPGNPLIFPR